MTREGDPFGAEGIWLKAALHTHTTRSDGELEPAAHVRHHERMGFDVCAITDHWTLTSESSTEHCLVITGAELAADPIGPGRYTEILGVGISELPATALRGRPRAAESRSKVQWGIGATSTSCTRTAQTCGPDTA